MALAEERAMDCFFGTYQLGPDDSDRLETLVTFNIPDLGIRFKAPFSGVDDNHCSFASLLSLLEFIDGNQNYLANKTYQIFGNDKTTIDQVNESSLAPDEFAPLMDKARNYRKKYRFSLAWIPTWENAAYDSLSD
ncbi:MAG: hypothetical protein V3T31_10595 [candidate division Zixibacteria bacterium]